MLIEEYIPNHQASSPSPPPPLPVQKKYYVCELQGDDSELVEDGVAGSFQTVDIDEKDVEELEQYLAASGDVDDVSVTLFAEGVTVENKTLKFPGGSLKEYSSISKKNNKNDFGGRRLAIHSTGTLRVVVVRVIAPNATTTVPIGPIYSKEVLSDKVFGTYGDQVNVRETYRSCSYDQLRMEPANHTTLTIHGVIEVTLPGPLIRSSNSSDQFVNAAKVELRKRLGGSSDNDIKAEFDQVIMCLPKGDLIDDGAKYDGTSFVNMANDRGWYVIK